jgi:TetR/AcrR family transcriptional regulator, tetracycline repressor protein
MPETTRRRAPWGGLTREQVVDAAERTVRAGGSEQMTIRSLAAQLDVAPMSLYRYVRDKDDLLDAVVDRLLARRWKPRAPAEDWVAWTSEAAERFREFLVSEPAALGVYLRHPVVSPSAMKRMEEMLAVLRGAGFDDESATGAYAALHTYTIGFAALQASRARASRRAASEEARPKATERQLASFTSARQFRAGLRYLLEGIQRGRC